VWLPLSWDAPPLAPVHQSDGRQRLPIQIAAEKTTNNPSRIAVLRIINASLGAAIPQDVEQSAFGATLLQPSGFSR
jgi:hypothetical protein